MIQDNQTNKVYLAEGLRHYMPVCMNLMNALRSEGIPFSFLPRTESEKHVWARDYMPIQINDSCYMRYVYIPDYLKGYEDYIPDYKGIDNDLNLNCTCTDIVLDGGNVIKCGQKVIMTDKVLLENNTKYKKDELLATLEKIFNAEVILIPWDRYDEYGHADGMVRSIDENRVLLNNYVDFDPNLRKRLLAALTPHFEVEELHYDTPRLSKYSWAYINFLQTEKCIFVPGLRIKEELLAMEQIQRFYPNHKVIRIDDCQDLVRDGGVLNCVSWNIKTQVEPNYNIIKI